MLRRSILLVAMVALVVGASACGADGDGDNASADGNTPAASETEIPEPVTLRLGYFPNVTHAQPQVGLARGTFEEALGSNVTVETTTFNAGPSVIEALFAGEIDISYIGPNPAINGYVRSDGEDLRIIAGATSGGAQLIVRPDADIESPADFANKRVATPQLGNTQDVALRAWLADNGLNAREQGGNVQVLPTANADQLTLFQNGDIDAAWAPEPWATRLIQEAGGELFLDEKDLWPDGAFVTTHIIVKTSFLEGHPDVVEDFLRAHVDTTEWILANPTEAKALVNESIEEITSKPLPQSVIDASWENIAITYDPIASSLFTSAREAFDLGFLGTDEPDLSGIYALDLLNEVLTERGLPPVAAE
jgi:NitT/TauT family transport system substrate-binding protein